MKVLLPEVILLLNIVRVTGSCEEGDEHIYSTNKVEATRCRDNKLFYYTLQYTNESFCTDSETMQSGHCWWDTTVQSHCLDSQECLWLDDNVLGGVCYCAETTGTCEVCNEQTPSPTYSGFECPDNCKVYYVGCASMYCNCFGECASAQELGCSDPVDPHCHTWYTDKPTSAPTSPKSVYWGCTLCCFGESKIHSTTSSVAKALEIEDNKVKIKSYTKVDQGDRRRSEVEEQWDIVYEIGLELEDSTQDMIDDLGDTTVLDTIAANINTDLGIALETIETTSVGEDDPTVPFGSSSSSNLGATIGGIIGALLGIVLLGFVGYRLYIWRNLGKYNVDTDRMTADGLCPVGEDEANAL